MEAQWLRMRQIISGYLAWKDDSGNHVLRFKQNPKLDALEALLDEMGDSKAVVCYDYTETGKMIVERANAMGIDNVWYYGGTKDQSATRRRFLDDPKCRLMVMNSEAGGTGNDGLQKVARYMVFYETPTPPITRKQTVKRIHRSGQERRSFVYDLVMTRSLDGGILGDLEASIDTHERVVNGRSRSRNFFLA
jgi:SNF2 family DNA or RNA helicase